ncbi:MAG: DNA lyase [Candidatus Pacearchaeota archaeon]|nr:DNA lyase [Candidatus Pacearchaeota archaeon]
MNLLKEYHEKKKKIKERLNEFKNLNKKDYLKEMIFCLLTPQSNAKKCFLATEEIFKIKNKTEENIKRILKTKTRFHNKKAKFVVEALKQWKEIERIVNNPNLNIVELRNYLADNVKGYGLKEASHFLRNIGKSDNKIAILDRHILNNLKSLKIIYENKIKTKNHYLEIERKFIDFSNKINIPLDELDLLFWSIKTGEIFK